MQIGGENMRIFINRPVLDNSFTSILDFDQLLESGIQKINLQIEGPPVHIKVKITQIWVV
jgi:hypothetical protein